MNKTELLAASDDYMNAKQLEIIDQMKNGFFTSTSDLSFVLLLH